MAIFGFVNDVEGRRLLLSCQQSIHVTSGLFSSGKDAGAHT